MGFIDAIIAGIGYTILVLIGLVLMLFGFATLLTVFSMGDGMWMLLGLIVLIVGFGFVVSPLFRHQR